MDTALVVGEALVDIVRGPGGTVTELAGGSPANVAVALSRLGRRATLVTEYADDRLGRIIDEHLRREGVDVVRQEPRSGRTSSADAVLGPGGAAAYEFDLAWSLRPWAPPAPPLVVHSGSLAALLSPGADGVAQTVERLREHATVTYDVNIRPRAMGRMDGVREAVLGGMARADVVKASDEDLEHLYPSQDPLETAADLLEYGPGAMVITRGGDGATVLTRNVRVDVAAPEVVVADTIGAGDSFCAAAIDALWELGLLGAAARRALHDLGEDGWRSVLEHAVEAAAITVQRPGADPPYRRDLA
ncbi:fructokinase [Nocardioides terrae]|uniref:Fructokinase n=1 Tax=Nocardioides terrae TaxID=574651 RepID=A0A1I1JTY1_9ACTN|nr:carbohydrate kinase [Nocardioides terrae]SFC52034.1 fructokinase [Nocardioides terrae]